MSDTTFVNGSTLTDADWMNDINRLHYTLLGDPATIAAIKNALFPTTEWVTPAFSAGDFTADGSMTWTVGAGDVTTYAYIINGKMMTIMFAIETSSIGGTPSDTVKIAIPASKVATKQTTSFCILSDNGAAGGKVTVVASGTVLNIGRIDGAVFTSSTNTTAVQGQITFEIN